MNPINSINPLAKFGWFIFVLFVLWVPSRAHADLGDIFSKFQPYIAIQEEYNSNIDLSPNRLKREDFIITVSPGINFSTSPRSATTGEFQRTPTAEDRYGIDLGFNAGFVFYAKEHDNNYISLNGTLNAWYALTQRLKFKVRDYLIRSDQIRETDYSPTAIEGGNLLSRTIRRVPYVRNVFEPSIEYQFGGENLIGVNYGNNIYKIQSRIYEDSVENHINPKLTYWFNIRNGISLEYGLMLIDFQRSSDLLGHMAMGRYTYRFNRKTSIFSEYTYLRRDFDPPSIDYDVHRPSLGVQHAFSPTLSGSAALGYFWQNPEKGSTKDGFFYDVNLSERAGKTTYTLSFQGGYREDYGTAQNLGFAKYQRALGRITHQLLQRMSAGPYSSYEWAKYGGGEEDRIWGIGADGSYQIIRWLLISLDLSHRENHSNISDRNYSEYRGMFRITATY